MNASKVYFYMTWTGQDKQENHIFDWRDTVGQVVDVLEEYGTKYQDVNAVLVKGQTIRVNIEHEGNPDGGYAPIFEPPSRPGDVTDQIAGLDMPTPMANTPTGRQHGRL